MKEHREKTEKSKVNAAKAGEVIKRKLIQLKDTSPMIAVAYIYLTLPILIFVTGWCRPVISIPASIVIVISLINAIADTPADWRLPVNKDNIIKLLLAAALIFMWVLLAGIGKGVYQNEDQPARNGLYEMLVRNAWPITKDVDMGGYSASRTLVYYIGFWLPSAIVGKISGMDAGYRFQIIWAVIGIFTMYYLLCAWRKKVVIWPLLIVVFFSGLDAVPIALITTEENLNFIWGMEHIERWPGIYQYSSMSTQLFWVFNQAIPCWLAVMFLWIQKNRKSLVYILSTVMLTSTLPFIGLLPIVIYYMFTKGTKENHPAAKGLKDSKSRIKQAVCQFVRDVFTVQNVIGGGCIGLLSYFYLQLNGSGSINTLADTQSAVAAVQSKAADIYVASVGTTQDALAIGASVRPMWGTMILLYVMFILFEFGIYMLILYKKQKNNPLYYLIFLLLCLIPFGKIGVSIDFCMRASIPALFIVMLMVIEYLDEEGKNYTTYLLIAVLIIGAVTPMHEIKRTVSKTINQGYINEIADEDDILLQGNFSGVVKDSVFGNYIMKVEKERVNKIAE